MGLVWEPLVKLEEKNDLNKLLADHVTQCHDIFNPET